MLREAILVYRSEIAVLLRNKPYLVMGMIQPVLYLVLCGPLLAVLVSKTPGVAAQTSWVDLTPALIIQIAATNGVYCGFVLLSGIKAGAVDRLRVTPVSRTALSLGQALPSVTLSLLQGVIILLLASLVFGVAVSAVGVVLVLVITALTALTIACCANAIVLKLRNEDTFSSIVNIVILPLTLLSGILLPITPDRAPMWLYVLSRFNPLAYVVDISRASFRETLPVVPTLVGAVVIIGLTALAVRWNSRTFQAVAA
ncbi:MULTISPECIES: ABC transporter permease [unclassified Amycolatopsis]|uniref:ABC transporter permease n=1 Tax=unclassified Amycolatopsis TaxID=2618356 RepID=UPI001FF44F94|nr:ABC transporter permease [Amycolatopsis sp. FBCC-B4732]UOX92943.1 ABC transporter permease [Amycolatopsis sp. FBCC-B4732]